MLKSLAMLLASGVECKADAIVPIIVDADDSLADKTRAVTAMDKYMQIRNKLDFQTNSLETVNRNRFFKTGLESVADIQNFTFPLRNTRDCDFKEFIGYNTLSRENRAMTSLLFSKKNLNSDMKVGFKGNPNIGSVVLNQFENSDEYKAFSSAFRQGDRIFIISSIFGGTGASGFPLLLKTLRGEQSSPSWNLLHNCKIGAVTVLPYFKLTQNPESGVDSSTFISKTKSALAYYDKNISGNRNDNLSSLYYIGDTVTNAYENHDGGTLQRNNAHFVEFCAALAVLHFASIPEDSFPKETQHYEYGIDDRNQEKEIETITFDNLFDRDTVQRPLTSFLLMAKYLINARENSYLYQPWAIDHGLDKNFFTGDFYKLIQEFMGYYREWLSEMQGNVRSFAPFNIDRVEPLFDMVKGKEATKDNIKNRLLKIKDYAIFDDCLNKSDSPKWNKNADKEQKFMEMFYRATETLTEKKYNMK